MEKILKVAVMLSAVDKMSTVIKNASDSGVKSLTRMQKEADRLSRSAFDLGRDAGAFGLAVAAPLTAAVMAAADYESMLVSLKTAFQGNEAEANKAFNTINKFAASTPYQLEEVMGGFIKLKNMGLDPSMDALTAYGNTASAMGKSLNEMVEAVADAATGEFERLKEFGIRASSEGDKVKFTFQGVTTTVKKDAKQIELYLKNLGLTKFAGGIEAQSKTFKGQMSTMMDNVKMFAASIGKMLLPVLNDLFKKMQPVIESIQKWMEKNPTLTRYIILGTAAVAALSLGVSALAFVFGGLMKVVSVGTTVIKVFFGAVRIASWTVRIFSATLLASGNRLAVFRGMVLQATTAILGKDRATKLATISQKIWNFTVQFGTTVMKVFRTALLFVGNAMKIVNLIFKSNPIILIITIIIGLVMALMAAWRPIVNFFKWLWDGVKNAFNGFWNWLKGWIMAPVNAIKGAWSKLTGFFKNLWTNIKNIFKGWVDWVMGLPKRFFQAGVKLVTSIWDGIKSKFNDMVNWFKKGLKKLRDMLPFSPAKEGPLRDIHRVKIVETIAENVKHEPLTRAMGNVTKKVRGAIPKQTGLAGAGVMMGAGAVMGGFSGGGGRDGGGGITVNFSPTINMSGGGANAKQEFLNMLKQFEPELMRVIQDATARADRKKFA